MIPEQIKIECSEFIKNKPDGFLCKPLHNNKSPIIKVKIRHKKIKEEYQEEFNNVFSSEYQKLLQRCLIAYTNNKNLTYLNESHELYYVFPINGYKFIYNPIIDYSLEQYNDLLDQLADMGSSRRDIFYSTIKLSYKSGDLAEAFSKSSEIIFYNIPYYYAVKKSLFDLDSQL